MSLGGGGGGGGVGGNHIYIYTYASKVLEMEIIVIVSSNNNVKSGQDLIIGRLICTPTIWQAWGFQPLYNQQTRKMTPNPPH